MQRGIQTALLTAIRNFGLYYCSTLYLHDFLAVLENNSSRGFVYQEQGVQISLYCLSMTAQLLSKTACTTFLHIKDGSQNTYYSIVPINTV
jgi:hypothetical protein